MSEEKVRLYKYVSMKRVIDILKKGRLYLSDGKNFNDPFEIKVSDIDSGELKHVEDLHILSLTNSHSNKLIWSHYSDAHKSVCLTVEVPKRWVYPVCYSYNRIFSDTNIDKLIDKSTIKCKKI